MLYTGGGRHPYPPVSDVTAGEVEQAIEGVDLNTDKGWDTLSKKIGVRTHPEHPGLSDAVWGMV